ncbi:IclR family transcriptional regulator domain-containing protein [Microbacterium halotolerans]|uniref:IclR family transcriptional regulator domain-containing protein n=1 Tax=Microbacterium halotolerans TaxID=246613 RepID=UPI000E6ACA80|nr:IclR family transcriptional regulator C-terminal domain-containing protein [Microbacterium halotolerans]
MPTQSRDHIQSLQRGVEVLRAFDGYEAALSVAEVSARVEFSRPVVRRILLTFQELGYADCVGSLWSLTPRILELGAGYFAASSLPEISYRYLPVAVERTGETCSVGVLNGDDVIHVARIEDHRPLPDAVRIGHQLPVHATALGKVLMADLEDAAFDGLLERLELERHTPHTVTDVRALRERVARVRESGFDVSIEELHPGMISAAVPIRVDGAAVGALSASSTTVRETGDSLARRIVPVLRQTASSIACAYRNANPQLFRKMSRTVRH